MSKLVDSLTEKDFMSHPVWKFINDDEKDEMSVTPVKKLPATNLEGKVVGCPVTFANGSKYFAMIGNVDAKNPRMNEHFISISFWRKGNWVHLARYSDPDFKRNGPENLSMVFGLKRSEIFPISYDLSRHAKGLKEALVGKIFEKPKLRLSQKKLIDLIVSNL